MMNEESTISFLNKYGTNLVGASDQFSSFDAEDDNYIVEIKNRRAYYAIKVIECNKLYSNHQKAMLAGKEFLYVVTDERGVYIFNMTKNINELVTTTKPITLLVSATTDFKRSKKCNKYFYELPVKMSKIIKNEL